MTEEMQSHPSQAAQQPEAKKGALKMLRKVLLLCGIFSSLVYIAADIVAARRYPGYIYTAQTVSEFSAIGAPTRPLWMIMVTLYTILLAAFGWGIWMSAH